MEPFTPGSATVNIDVSASNQRVQITTAEGRMQIRYFNNGTATVWIAFGDSSVAATVAGSMPVPAGGIEVFTVNKPYGDVIYAAAIAAASTGKIYFTPGAGI